MFRDIFKHRKLIFSYAPKVSYTSLQYKESKLSEQFKDITIYKNLPNDPDKLYPTLIYIPGTAFVALEENYTNFICSCIAQLTNCQVIAIKHKLAPEHNPISILNGLYHVIKNLLSEKHSTLLQIDRSRISIGGYSSGGTLAVLMAIKAKANGLVFNHQILISPVTDLSRTITKNTKYQTFEDQDYVIHEQFVKWFLDLYLPNSIDRKNPTLSPYWCNSEILKQLSATYLTFGEFDRFRGDAELYAQKLRSINVPVYECMFSKETHGLLWKNNEVICSVAKQLKCLLEPEFIEKPLTSKNNKNIKKRIKKKS